MTLSNIISHMSMKRFEHSGLAVRGTPHSEKIHDKMWEFQVSEPKIYCIYSLGNNVCMETFNRIINNAVYIIVIRNYSYLLCISVAE